MLGPPTSRRWAYAVSKLFDEHVCWRWPRSAGCRVTILRFFGSYGPRNHPSWWGGPQAAFIEALLDGEIIDIHGDGQQIRTFTFVDDTVDGIVRAMGPPRPAARSSTSAAASRRTILELAEACSRRSGSAAAASARSCPTSRFPASTRTSVTAVPDTGRPNGCSGFRAHGRLDEGLAAHGRVASGATRAGRGRR